MINSFQVRSNGMSDRVSRCSRQALPKDLSASKGGWSQPGRAAIKHATTSHKKHSRRNEIAAATHPTTPEEWADLTQNSMAASRRAINFFNAP
jgi:hypothetical protein